MTKEAFFRVSFKLSQRSKGNNAVRMAAYQMCAKMKFDRRMFNFTRKKDEHLGHLLLIPNNAPAWAYNPEALWTAAEKAETRINSQTARMVLVTIPREIPADQYRSFARALFMPLRDAGMCVQIDIQTVRATDGQMQPHIHALLTMRRISKTGFAKSKERAWNAEFGKDGDKNVPMRKAFADRMNAWMKANKIGATVDHRSKEARGLPPAIPVPKIPAWQFKKHRAGETPQALGDLLLLRSVRRKGLTAQQAIKRIDDTLKQLNVPRHSTAPQPHLGSIGSSRRERYVAKAIREHYDLKEWLPATVANNIAFTKYNASGHLLVTLSSGAYFIDRGDRIDLHGRWSAADLEEMATAAVRNRWDKAEVWGSSQFKDQLTVALALKEPPIQVTNYTLSVASQKRLETALREREAARLAHQLAAAQQAFRSAERPKAGPKEAPPPDQPEMAYRYEYRPKQRNDHRR